MWERAFMLPSILYLCKSYVCLDSLLPESVSPSFTSQTVSSTWQTLEFLFSSLYPHSESSPRTEPKSPFCLHSAARQRLLNRKRQIYTRKKIPEKLKIIWWAFAYGKQHNRCKKPQRRPISTDDGMCKLEESLKRSCQPTYFNAIQKREKESPSPIC